MDPPHKWTPGGLDLPRVHLGGGEVVCPSQDESSKAESSHSLTFPRQVPSERTCHTAVVHKNRMYVLGGMDQSITGGYAALTWA